MKKTAALSLIIALSLSHVSYAFLYEPALEDQITEYSDTELNTDGSLKLGMQSSAIRALDISPNYTNDKLMYLSTQNGVYLNRSFDANFQKDEALSEYFPNGFMKIQFEGFYKDTGMILAYDKTDIYISYNYGNSWDKVVFDMEEEIVEADFGPKFDSGRHIYVVTKNGLYRKSLTNESIEKMLTADTEGELKNFRYVRTQQTDRTYFIVKGDTLYKTEDYGSTWIQTKFNTGIRDFEIKQTTLNEGNLMVLTDDNVIHFSNWAINFFELDLPAEINSIMAVDYLILTDQGYYITYTNGDSWQKLNYVGLNPSLVSDYDLAVNGSQKLLFVTEANVLKRDLNLVESLNDYMTGITLDKSYTESGYAVSKDVLAEGDMQFGSDYAITRATLFIDGDLNEQTANFYMTANGFDWEEVTANELYTFEFPGTELKWKIELATDNSAVSPVINTVSLDYGVDEMTSCAGFTDIPYDDPHCPAITYVKNQGIFSGYPDGTFNPEQPIVRAETVKVIVEGFNYSLLEDDGTNLGFSDVIVGEWYMPYLKTAKEAGIIEGYPDGTFKPAETVIYVEMLKIFFETAGVVLPEYIEGAEWYQPYVDYANLNELVPYDNVEEGMKRVDVAELFYQWSQL